MRSRFFAILILGFIFGCTSNKTDEQPEFKGHLYDIELKDIKDDAFNWERVKNAKASVFIFFSPECPLSENYTLTTRNLRDTFSTDNVAFFAVFPGTYYTKDEILKFRAKYSLDIPFIMDPEYKLVHALDAEITPEAFVIGPEGNVKYHGAIDNWAITLGRQRKYISEHYLKDALAAVLSGKPVKVSETDAVGCFIE